MIFQKKGKLYYSELESSEVEKLVMDRVVSYSLKYKNAFYFTYLQNLDYLYLPKYSTQEILNHKVMIKNEYTR